MKQATFTPAQIEHAFNDIAGYASSLAGLLVVLIENASPREADLLTTAKMTAYTIGLMADHMTNCSVIGDVEDWIMGSAFVEAGKPKGAA